MHSILPNLWLGDIHDAMSLSSLREHQITAVVNCTSDTPFMHGIEHTYRISTEDNGDTRQFPIMGRELPRAVEWIHYMLTHNQKVLVHCLRGRQRSCCVVAAYMLRLHPEWSVNDAVNYVRLCRSQSFFCGDSQHPQNFCVNFKSALVTYKKWLEKNHSKK